MNASTERTREGLSLLFAGIIQAASLTLRAAVVAAEKSAKGTHDFKNGTGNTRASIKSEAFGTRGFVQAGGASRFLESGTAPHRIEAHGKALRFVVGGSVMFRKFVNHPGTKPRPFMTEARQRGEQAAEYGAEFYVSEAIRRAR